jgi:hypothetical protein
MPLQRWFAIAAVAAAFVTGTPAFAQQVVITTYGPFSVTSTSGTQLSNTLYTTNVTTAGTLQVRYNAAPGHCSDVRAHILVDGVERGLTAFLAAGQSSALVDVGPVTPGAHVVALQGEGRVSGCNAGVLVGWAGTMDVATSVAQAPAGQAIPGPGLLATLLAFVAGALLFGPWRRRR